MNADVARAALAGLVPDDVLADPDAALDRYARARWACLVEPGDGVAGRLVSALGAAAALRCVFVDEAMPEGIVTPRELAQGRARWRPRRDEHHHALHLARRARVRLIVPGDPHWPARIDDLGPHAPLCLWARGCVEVLAADAPAAAIVGARAATAYGVQVAAEIAGDLGAAGVVVVSGAAVGIDAAAHEATIAVEGRGVAVLAGGVERAYPSGHADLLARLCARGVVVSEAPCGGAPTKWRFLQRNRLIAALSDATVVVEAGWRSGSLNTAGHAAALGRPLGAVPGPVTSAASAGCHRVLREYDGTCITGADDVGELLGWQSEPVVIPGERTDATTRVLDALSTRSSRPVDEIARRSGLAGADILPILGLLALEARAVQDGAGWRAAPS